MKKICYQLTSEILFSGIVTQKQLLLIVSTLLALEIDCMDSFSVAKLKSSFSHISVLFSIKFS